MGCGVACDRFYRKCSADVWSRVNNKAAVGRPRGIDRVLRYKRNGRATVNRYAKEVRGAAIGDCRGDRLAVGRPCWTALQIERISHHSRIRAIRLCQVQERSQVLPG